MRRLLLRRRRLRIVISDNALISSSSSSRAGGIGVGGGCKEVWTSAPKATIIKVVAFSVVDVIVVFPITTLVVTVSDATLFNILLRAAISANVVVIVAAAALRMTRMITRTTTMTTMTTTACRVFGRKERTSHLISHG